MTDGEPTSDERGAGEGGLNERAQRGTDVKHVLRLLAPAYQNLPSASVRCGGCSVARTSRIFRESRSSAQRCDLDARDAIAIDRRSPLCAQCHGRADETLYPVERILERRRGGSEGAEFLVHWAG